MDLQWNFSATPLRMCDCRPSHWSRLHAKYKGVFPQADGSVATITQSIGHVDDEVLCARVLSSGIAKPKKERTLPELPPRPPVNTPLLRERLKAKTILPLPQPSRSYVARTDGASVFSKTTAASKASSQHGSAHASSCGPKSSVGKSSRRSSKQDLVEKLRDELEQEKHEQKEVREELAEATKGLESLERAVEERAPSAPVDCTLPHAN